MSSTNRRVLSPIDRVSEVLFGLIMVLTFTGSLSVAEAGRADVRIMLIGALGCNLAWGIIDAILYVMGEVAEHRRAAVTLGELRRTTDPERGRGIVADALPSVVASVLTSGELETMRQRLTALPAPSAPGRVGSRVVRGAFGVFLLVFLSTLPVALPFVFMDDAVLALRISNGIAIAMLFATGYAYGRIVGRHGWIHGVAMVLVGSALASLTMALGG